MSIPRNIVGPQVRFFRNKNQMTQQELATKLNLAGWEISRETLAKIESQLRWVADAELVCLASGLGVSVESLLPRKSQLPTSVTTVLGAPRSAAGGS